MSLIKIIRVKLLECCSQCELPCCDSQYGEGGSGTAEPGANSLAEDYFD
jgi:hypothetical protein